MKVIARRRRGTIHSLVGDAHLFARRKGEPYHEEELRTPTVAFGRLPVGKHELRPGVVVVNGDGVSAFAEHGARGRAKRKRRTLGLQRVYRSALEC